MTLVEGDFEGARDILQQYLEAKPTNGENFKDRMLDLRFLDNLIAGLFKKSKSIKEYLSYEKMLLHSLESLIT